jgi:hypothetical protein
MTQKALANRGFFGGEKDADRRVRGESRGGKGLRGKEKTAHVTFYLNCYIGCCLRTSWRTLPCLAAFELILPYVERLVNTFLEFFQKIFQTVICRSFAVIFSRFISCYYVIISHFINSF